MKFTDVCGIEAEVGSRRDLCWQVEKLRSVVEYGKLAIVSIWEEYFN
jgi:hypothetical protein